jgi:hypothetical protein
MAHLMKLKDVEVVSQEEQLYRAEAQIPSSTQPNVQWLY